jgi:hypothetical protein
MSDTLNFSTRGKKNGKNRVIGVIFITTLFISLPTAYGETIYVDFGNNGFNEKLMVSAPVTNNRLEITTPTGPGAGFSAGRLENSNQYLGFYNGGHGQSKAVLVALNNFQITEIALTTFLPVVIKNPPQPPVGVWDSSTWNNSTWGN